MPNIGIFPLGIVLFPGSSYPLTIFEERYKLLIREVTDSGGRFGINLFHDHKMFQIGCEARVSQIVKVHPDGIMDIIVTGGARFLISEFFTDQRPYMTAEVAMFDDDEPRPEYPLLETTIGYYNRLVESVYGEAEESLDPADWLEGGASFRMAQKCGLDLDVRQQLLEVKSENERLRFLSSYFTEVLPKIKQVEKIQMLVRNDGYISPDRPGDWDQSDSSLDI
ncbi:MAG: ATP-dependent protease [Chlorobi bacterium]|nr:ATP-dependent protease [Chlorobiota bacterium]